MKAWRQVGAVAAAAGLHVLLGGLMSMRPGPTPPAPPMADRMTVVIVAPRATERPRLQGERLRAYATSMPRAPRVTAARNARPTIAASTTANSAPVPAVVAALPAASAASQASKPLDLAWRRGTTGNTIARNPALDDARASTARSSPEERMARRFDTAVHEELRADGSVRIRRGDDCIDLRASRASELFAADGTTRPLPRLASACP